MTTTNGSGSMELATTYPNANYDFMTHSIGVARAVDHGTTARAVELVRSAGRLALFAAGFVSIWGVSGLFGTLVGMH
jgi:hypothetical protein